MKINVKKINWNVSLYTTQVLLLGTAFALIGMKFFKWDYSFEKLIPEVIYDLQVTIDYENFDEPIQISTFLPATDDRQTVLKETQENDGLIFESQNTELGRRTEWYTGTQIPKKGSIIYSTSLLTRKKIYQLPDDLNIPKAYSHDFKKYLMSTSTIQSRHPIIVGLYDQIIPDTSNTREIIQAIYDYVSSLPKLPFKGLTDAVTAAKLEEASCNGKSRLFVALARRANIPARLVGGLILNVGTKKASHQWLELYLNGYWVPFDALNNHFAEIPQNYLALYRGDEFLFSHSPNLIFNYNFKIRKNLAIGKSFQEELLQHPFNSYKAWEVFDRLGLSLSLLQIIIMIPFGAFVITIFRNVIGLETFGTFLPALIAAASRQTGLLWGLIGFLLVIIIVALIHYPLEKWRILHNPKMSILMIIVVNVLLAFTIISHNMGLSELSFVSLFPIAVLTITSERFSQMIFERGFGRALKVMMMTLIVIAAAFIAMNSLAIQSLFLALPELFLILLVMNLWIGRWIGLRLIEFWRFRWLLT